MIAKRNFTLTPVIKRINVKKTAWIIYGIIIILSVLFALGIAISTGDALIVTLISSVITVLYLSGLYGYVYHKVIWKPSGWRFLFWLSVTAHCIRVFLLLFSSSKERVIDVLFSAAFSFPMLYALYHYSSSSFVAWGESRYGKLKKILSDLLSGTNEPKALATISSSVGDERLTVSVRKEENEFVVKLQRQVNDEIKSFSNTFSDLEDVAKFLEKNTPLSVTDLASSA